MSRPLIEALGAATDVRGAAGVVLIDALARVRVALPSAPAARPLRAILHLRPDHGYSGVYLLEEGAPDVHEPAPDDDAVTSATAWRWVSRSGRAVVFDVEADAVRHLSGERPPAAEERPRWIGRTEVALRRRRATHVVVLPLRAPGRRLVGMLAIEVEWPAAVGDHPATWARLEEGLQLLSDLAGFALVSLPSPAAPEVEPDPLLPVVGAAMARVVRTLRAFARFDQTLLLRGATGTGKSHLAAWCHAHSARAKGPFVVSSLLTSGDGLRDAGLFGWRKGAFTGAVTDSQGAVAQAAGGTLFIDEIDKLDLASQGRLLRLLEERRYRVLGEERERVADARFIVGTNADLEGAVERGTFLRDLYYRVNVLPIEVPPLAARRDEVPGWARRMAAAAVPGGPGGDAPRFTAEAELLLAGQPWPGNLRQLNSVVVRAVALALSDTLESEAEANTLVVREEHLRRALALDPEARQVGGGGLLEGLGQAARALVDEAERRASRGEAPLDLDLADGFRGLVLSEASARRGGVREAFALFGLDHQLRGGNHLRTWRRETDRLDALCQALRVPSPPRGAEGR